MFSSGGERHEAQQVHGRADHRRAAGAPPELAVVADAYNSMTRTILEQREQLSDYARRDSLASLLNRGRSKPRLRSGSTA